jgi:hypothetical protein
VWFSLVVFTLFLYPTLLLGSSYVGSTVGLNRDVNASRALARALSYAADPHFLVSPGNDGQLATSALDSNLVALHLDNDQGPSGSASATPANGGIVAVTPSNPIAAPSPHPTAPVSPNPSPRPSPAPSPTPCSPPRGSGTFAGKVLDAGGKVVGGATVILYWKGCFVGRATTGANGAFAIPRLAPKTSYTYSFSARGHPQGHGSFVTAANGNYSHNPQFLR